MAGNDRARLSCLLKELREAAGLSSNMLAGNIRISKATYEGYEREGPTVPLGILYSISHHLGMNVTVLLSGGKAAMDATITCHSNGDIRFERRTAGDRKADNGEPEQRARPDNDAETLVEVVDEVRSGKKVAALSWADVTSTHPKKIEKENKEKEMVYKWDRELHTIPQKGIIDWQPSYTTRIEFIDKQYREFVSLVNDLYQANILGWKHAQEVFKKILRWSVGHIEQLHNEETIMERISYPARGIHRREHKNFIKEIARQAQIIQARKRPDISEFILFSREWMQGHVGIDDRDVGLYLVKLKRRGALGNIMIKVKHKADGRIVTR